MTTLVPIVVLINRDVQPTLAAHVEAIWADLPHHQRVRFKSVMERNGWTREMIVLGNLLEQATKVNAAIERLSTPT